MTSINETDVDLTPEQARREASRLTAYADERTAASPAAVEMLRTAIESTGFTIEGLRDDMTLSDVRYIALELGNQMSEMKARTSGAVA